MIEITNGSMKLKVAKGAHREIFAPLGWVLIDNKEPDEETLVEDTNSASMDLLEAAGDEPEEELEDELDPVEDEIEELLEKPISQMSYGELIQYASHKGVEVSDCKNKKEIREKLKKALN